MKLKSYYFTFADHSAKYIIRNYNKMIKDEQRILDLSCLKMEY